MKVVPVRPDLGKVSSDLAAGPVEDRQDVRRLGRLLEDTEGTAEQEADEVALLAVRRHNPVGQEEVERPGVVDQERGLPGRERASELFVLRSEDCFVGGLGPAARPHEPFEAVTGVDHAQRHRLQPVALADVHHEDERRELEASDAHAERGADVPAALPLLLLVGDRFRVRSELARQELVAEFGAPLLEVDLVVGPVEGVVRHHLEQRKVAAAPADLFEVDEPQHRLADGERVRGRGNRTVGDPGLEVVDRRLGEEDVVAPARDRRIASDPRVAVPFEEREVRLAHRAQVVRSGEDRVADEPVVPARRLLTAVEITERPEGVAADDAGAPVETALVEELEVVLRRIHDGAPTAADA